MDPIIPIQRQQRKTKSHQSNKNVSKNIFGFKIEIE